MSQVDAMHGKGERERERERRRLEHRGKLNFIEVIRAAHSVLERRAEGAHREAIATELGIHIAWVDYLLAMANADMDDAFDRPGQPWAFTLTEAEIIAGVRERDGTLVEYYRGHLPARPEVW